MAEQLDYVAHVKTEFELAAREHSLIMLQYVKGDKTIFDLTEAADKMYMACVRFEPFA